MLFDDLPDPNVFLTATRNFQNGRYFTVNVGQLLLAFRFPNSKEALQCIRRLGFLFEYSPGRNAFRNSSGELISAPPVWVARRYVEADECEVEGNGHHVLGGEIWDATMHTDEDWQPVEVVDQTGLRTVIATPTGVDEVFHHDPWAMQFAVKYCVGYNVMQCNFPEESGIKDPFISLARADLRPCSRQVYGPEVPWKIRYFL